MMIDVSQKLIAQLTESYNAAQMQSIQQQETIEQQKAQIDEMKTEENILRDTIRDLKTSMTQSIAKQHNNDEQILEMDEEIATLKSQLETKSNQLQKVQAELADALQRESELIECRKQDQTQCENIMQVSQTMKDRVSQMEQLLDDQVQ